MIGKRNNTLRKRMAVLCLALMMALLPAGCGQSASPAGATDETLSVVVTIFPVYDWVKNILGEEGDARLTLLLDSGVDMHSFQPTAQDILTISTCDVFFYIGGESDAWVEDALRESSNPDMVVVNLLEALGERAVTEEVLEGGHRVCRGPYPCGGGAGGDAGGPRARGA